MFFSASHLSFSFAFFVHGESTVCASIDVRQHSVVRTLSKEHLAQASSQPQNGNTIQGIFYSQLLMYCRLTVLKLGNRDPQKLGLCICIYFS